MLINPVLRSSFLLFSNTMKWRNKSSSVDLFNMPSISVSNWLTRCEASVLPSALFQVINRDIPADNEPALASKPSEITMNALEVNRLGVVCL